MAHDTSDQMQRAERVSFDAIVDAVSAAGSQFIAQLRELEPSDASRPVPAMTWTVAETAAHMLTIVGRGTGDRRRADSLTGLAELNDECIAGVPTRDLGELADAIEAQLGLLCAGLRSIDAATAEASPFPLHAGVTANVPSALSYAVFDFLAHGSDIARATHRDWIIDPGHAALVMHASLPILDPWVNASVRDGDRQRFALSFPGDGDAIVMEVGDGTFRAQNEPRESAGDIVEAEPVNAFLTLAGRATPATAAIEPLATWFEPI